MKKQISILLCLLLGTLASCSTSDNNSKNKNEIIKDGLRFELDLIDDCYVVYGDKDDLIEVEVPASINKKPVKKIGDNAFYENKYLKRVNLPDTIESIGSYAFYSCSQLEQINLNDNLLYVQNGAFQACNRLFKRYNNGIYIASENNPYQFLYKAEESNGNTFEIHEDTNVILPRSFEYLDIEYIDVPNKVKVINEYAFSCYSLQEVNLPDSLIEIGKLAFDDCHQLKSVVIPDSVEKIEENAFNLNSLESITLSNNLTICELGVRWFASDIPLQFNQYMNGYYIGSKDNPYMALARVTSSDTTEFTFAPEVKFVLNDAFNDCENLTSINLPDTLLGIGQKAFYGAKLNEIIIPDSVTKVGREAFGNCTNLTKVKWSKNTPIIEEYTFCDYSYLGDRPFCEFEIPEGVKVIEKGAISLKLSSVHIPSTVVYIGYYQSFSGRYVESITVDKNNKVYDSRKDCNAIIETAEDRLIYTCKNTVLVNGIKIIGSYAFESSELTSITLPNSVIYIETYAFSDCENLTNITLSDNIKHIESGAFTWCENLVYNEYLGGKYLGSEKRPYLMLCGVVDKTIDEITIHPQTVLIDDGVFMDCVNLLKVEVPEGVLYIGCGAFSGCTNLKELTLPSTLLEIDGNAFENCSSLEQLIIPEGTKIYGEYVFWGCNSLKALYLPASVTSIYKIGFPNSDVFVIYSGAKRGEIDYGSYVTVYYKGEWKIVDGVYTPINK